MNIKNKIYVQILAITATSFVYGMLSQHSGEPYLIFEVVFVVMLLFLLATMGKRMKSLKIEEVNS